MKRRFILLLTRDAQFKKLLADVLGDHDTAVLAEHSIAGALQVICSGESQPDLAVIDFDDGCHGMTLLNAFKACRPALPIVVVISTDVYHAAAVAYANGVEACLAKPITAADLRMAVATLGVSKVLFAA